MLVKNANETIVLIPTDIPFEYRDRYEYQWMFKHDIFSTNYEAHFDPYESGDHRFKLVTIDKTSGLKGERDYTVRVAGERDAIKPIFAITCIYEYVIPGNEAPNFLRKEFAPTDRDLAVPGSSTKNEFRSYYDARNFGLEYSDEIEVFLPEPFFPPEGTTENTFGPYDMPKGWFWEGDQSIGIFPSYIPPGPKAPIPIIPISRESNPYDVKVRVIEFYTNLITDTLEGSLNNPLRVLLSGIAPQAQRWMYIGEKDPRWELYKNTRESPKTNMIFEMRMILYNIPR